MPQILGEIGLEPTDLPDHSTLVKWFDRIKTALWRVLLLRLAAQLHGQSGHAAIDATFSTAKTQQTLLPSDELPGSDAQSDSSRRHRKPSNSGRSLYDRETPDTQLGWQVARRNADDLASLTADKGYDWMDLRENSAKTA